MPLHSNEIGDVRSVRVLVRAEEDPDRDLVVEDLYEAVHTGRAFGEGGLQAREQAAMVWWQERGQRIRDELKDGLAMWFRDLSREGVPAHWIVEVMECLTERLAGLEREAANGEQPEDEDEDGELKFLNIQDVHGGWKDERDIGFQILDAMDNVVDNAVRVVQGAVQGAVQSASRQVMGFARRGFEALAAQITGEENERTEESEESMDDWVFV